MYLVFFNTPDLFHSHYFQFQNFENILMYGVYLILFGMQIYMHKFKVQLCLVEVTKCNQWKFKPLWVKALNNLFKQS